MQLAFSLRLVASSAILGALGCGEDPANANVCPNLPLYHVVRSADGVDTLVKPNGSALSSADITALRRSEEQGCTTPVGTALTDPPRGGSPPPTSSGGSGAGGSGAGGSAGADGGA